MKLHELFEDINDNQRSAYTARLADLKKQYSAIDKSKDAPGQRERVIKLIKDMDWLKDQLASTVTEGTGSKPNMRGVEAELKAHTQRKIEHEKENGPMVAHELVSHEQRRKQLMKKLSRERSKANKAE